MLNIKNLLASEFGLDPSQVEAVLALIDDGNSIPFIARYRKEATGGIDDVTLRDLDERCSYLKKLEARKAEVLRLIEADGKLVSELRAKIEEATVMQRVEDLYKPYKKKRATRASKARDAGLEPLALHILEQGQPAENLQLLAEGYADATGAYNTAESALQGALDIVAEIVADDADHLAVLRDFTRRHGTIAAESSAGKNRGPADAEDGRKESPYEMYHEFQQPILKIPNHRILAINRGEKEGELSVKVRIDEGRAIERLAKRVIKRHGAYAEPLKACLADCYKRLIAPSLEREIRTELTKRAETAAIRVFAKNTEHLLLQRPVRNARVIAIDPGYRTGCKVAVLDEYGKLLDYTTIYPTPPRSEVEKAQTVLARYAKQYAINVIVIGNGTGCRETEEVVADFIDRSNGQIRYTIVNEAGASVYSASKLASEEYPDLDVTTRGAMSLGRRLQDPLAELVKIPPQSIGVGQYQHDLDQPALAHALAGVVENVVNRVGVDLNTASASLLGYVSGISPGVAKNIVAYREEQGAFTERRQLKEVPKLGTTTFRNCAGFLRISGGKNPLDSTSVHPESYPIAVELLSRSGMDLTHPSDNADAGAGSRGAAGIAQRLGDLSALAAELAIGLPTLRDIVSELEKPGRDPRDDAPEPIFSRVVRSFDDLAVNMELTGTVRNVVDFGAFVDIGVKQDGLVHISKMADHFIHHPSEVVSVGDTVTVWVSGIDKHRGKVSLTMLGIPASPSPSTP